MLKSIFFRGYDMPIKDYYKILGVSPGADEAAIKKSFRSLAKQYHPDANPGNKAAEEKFKEISEAYEVLTNKEKRAKYEQLKDAQSRGFDFSQYAGRGHGQPSQGAGQGQDFSEMFGDIFSGRGSSKAGGFEDLFDMFFDQGPKRGFSQAEYTQEGRGAKGEDVNIRIEIPFALAMEGGETIIKVPRAIDCTRCRGTGAEPGAQVSQCEACHGAGTMQFSQGGFVVNKTCPRCGGKGSTITDFCHECKGSGESQEIRKIRIHIPEGVKEGEKIRIKGEGNMRSWNKERGDLYVIFKVEKSDTFERKGDDVYFSVKVNMAQAILGGHMEVPTPDGNIEIKIPVGIQSGTSIKMSGHGAKNIKTGKKGNFYVQVEVETPKAESEEEKELIKNWAKIKKWDV
jgi:molecular chaperone DnaJ